MSLFKRTNSPYWYTEIIVKGRRIVRSTGARTRRDAEQFEKQLREQAIRQLPASSAVPVLTLDHACGRYWIEHGRRLKDARNVQRWLRYCCDFIDARTPLADLSAKHVAAMVAAMRAKGIGEISINRTVTTLHGVHSIAAKRWEQPVKVIDWSAMKTKERARVRHLDPAEAARLIDALPLHIRQVCQFMFMTGLRKREAFNLRWENVKASSITVRVKGGYERTVALSDEAILLLASLPKDREHVFDTTNWRRHFETALDRAQITNFRWHDIRHSFATWLGQSGAALEVIKDHLGHSSVSVTEKYRHVIGTEVRSALGKMPRLLDTDGKVVAMRRKNED